MQEMRLPASLRVLVVDDHFEAADSLGILLELRGADVRVVHDGLAAIEAIRNFRPHVAMLDIAMPGLNGFEVAERLRAEQLMPPLLIAMTGWGHEENRQRTLAAGFHEHRVKPLDIEALIRRLAEVEV
ncbi:MAG TPA: response regulator [Gemmatimonadales bacterium]|nr:response regulator [Gemmatimonadales bacterium]